MPISHVKKIFRELKDVKNIKSPASHIRYKIYQELYEQSDLVELARELPESYLDEVKKKSWMMRRGKYYHLSLYCYFREDADTYFKLKDSNLYPVFMDMCWIYIHRFSNVEEMWNSCRCILDIAYDMMREDRNIYPKEFVIETCLNRISNDIYSLNKYREYKKGREVHSVFPKILVKLSNGVKINAYDCQRYELYYKSFMILRYSKGHVRDLLNDINIKNIDGKLFHMIYDTAKLVNNEAKEYSKIVNNKKRKVLEECEEGKRIIESYPGNNLDGHIDTLIEETKHKSFFTNLKEFIFGE